MARIKYILNFTLLELKLFILSVTSDFQVNFFCDNFWGNILHLKRVQYVFPLVLYAWKGPWICYVFHINICLEVGKYKNVKDVFPGDSMIKNPSTIVECNRFDPCSGKIPRATERLSLCVTAVEPVLSGSCQCWSLHAP